MPRIVAPLTDARVRSAKTPEKKTKLVDGGGLFLLLHPDGGRYWQMKYRFDGREGDLSFGTYPAVSLADARKRREEARDLVQRGQDPKAVAREARVTANANTFETVAREWLEKQGKAWSDSHRLNTAAWLEKNLFPTLGKRPVADITPTELLTQLRRIEKRGAAYSAERLRRTAGQVFRYAIATARATRNPAADLKGALAHHEAEHFATITEPARVGGLLRAIWGYSDAVLTVRVLLKLTPYLFARPGEMRVMQWADVTLSGPEPVWRYYPAKANSGKSTVTGQARKRKSAHFIPLPRQAVALLKDLHALTGDEKLVFPGIRGRGRPLSENTLNAALRALGFDMTGHGFRHMASTLLNSAGFNRDHIERQLAHKDKDPIRGTYNLADYAAERREMMQWYADYLDSLRTGQPAPVKPEETVRSKRAYKGAIKPKRV